MLLDFGALTEEAYWIHRLKKIYVPNLSKYFVIAKNQIVLKFEGFERFLPSLVPTIIQC